MQEPGPPGGLPAPASGALQQQQAAAAASSSSSRRARRRRQLQQRLSRADRRSLEVEAIQALARLGVVVRACDFASTSDAHLATLVQLVADRLAGHL